MLDKRINWPARGHLAGHGGFRQRNGGEILGPQAPQPAVPPLSSEEIELSGGSASAGGAAVSTTATSAKNANAITTDTISPGERRKVSFLFGASIMYTNVITNRYNFIHLSLQQFIWDIFPNISCIRYAILSIFRNNSKTKSRV